MCFDCDLTNWKIKDEEGKNLFFLNFILKNKKEIKLIVSKESRENNAENLYWIRIVLMSGQELEIVYFSETATTN